MLFPTVFFPYPLELRQPAIHGEMKVMPLSEQTGSHSSAEHEQCVLHSEKSISLWYDNPSVLQGQTVA